MVGYLFNIYVHNTDKIIDKMLCILGTSIELTSLPQPREHGTVLFIHSVFAWLFLKNIT